MSYLLALIRLVLFALIAFITTVTISLSRLFGMGHKTGFFIFGLAVKSIRFLLNIRVSFTGEIPSDCVVIMSNHRSYIDIVLIPSLIPYVIVAKKQVGSWPIIGATARAIKVIFVDRDSVESRRKTRADILNRLKAGYSVLIYPEGTTFKGPGILPMKPGIFSTCAAEAIPIVPVAIEFEDKSMAWIGTDTFIPHFIQAFRNWRINVGVSMGPVLKSDNSVELRAAVETWVDNETRRMA